MDALAKLTDLYSKRDELNKQIQAISDLLGVAKEEKKERKKRGPNKKKEEPLKLVPPKLPGATL